MKEKFEHKKSLGQHFLNSDYVPKQMCDAADLTAGDVVVEIGPGTGVLTKEILECGAKVIAVEADPRAIAALEENFSKAIAQEDLNVIHTDARKLNLNSLDVEAGNYKVVANIPYYISGLLFRTFLDSDTQPSTLVFLVQKELAQRIARDKKESLLSLSVKAFGNVQYISTIKRGHFTPPPKVDSAILAVSYINNKYFADLNKDLFFSVIKYGFGNKRKQLAPNLKPLFEVEKTKQILVGLGISPTVRAEDLTLSHWSQLIKKLSKVSPQE